MHNSRYYYDLCCQHKGKVVRIHERNGRAHVGRIVEVDEKYVWIERQSREVSGFGYGFWGPGWGWGYRRPYYGYAVPVALAAIGGFALGAAFLW